MNDSEVFKIAESILKRSAIHHDDVVAMARWILDRRWHRVEDGLPENDDEVLVYGLVDGEKEINMDFFNGHVFHRSEIPPTHWTIIPQPPEEE